MAPTPVGELVAGKDRGERQSHPAPRLIMPMPWLANAGFEIEGRGRLIDCSAEIGGSVPKLAAHRETLHQSRRQPAGSVAAMPMVLWLGSTAMGERCR